jgi:hypothetical protein
VGDCQTGSTGSVMPSNTQHQTQTYFCINVIFLFNRGVENIKVFENFWADFKN